MHPAFAAITVAQLSGTGIGSWVAFCSSSQRISSEYSAALFALFSTGKIGLRSRWGKSVLFSVSADSYRMNIYFNGKLKKNKKQKAALTFFKQNPGSKVLLKQVTNDYNLQSFVSHDLSRLCCFTDSHLLWFSCARFLHGCGTIVTWWQQAIELMGSFNSILRDPQTVRTALEDLFISFFFSFFIVRCDCLLLLGGWKTLNICDICISEHGEEYKRAFRSLQNRH